MSLKLSTGASKFIHATGSLKKCFTGGLVKVYSSPVPATADAAATGTLLYTLTNDAATVKAKQKIRFTPVPGTAAISDWSVTLNGVKFSFTTDGTPSVAEICTGLYNLIRAGINTTTITTPAGAITIPDVTAAFVLTDNATSLDIEAAVAGVPFTYTPAVAGSSPGTGSWTTAITVSDAYGLQFEDASTIESGVMEKLSTQVWAARAVADGTPAYYRIVRDGDTGALSTTEERMQGVVSTVVGSEFEISHATVKINERQDVTSASYTIPLA